MRSIIALGSAYTRCRIPSAMDNVMPPLAAGESIQPMKGSSVQLIMIEGLTIVTGVFPRSFFRARSAYAFEKV